MKNETSTSNLVFEITPQTKSLNLKYNKIA